MRHATSSATDITHEQQVAEHLNVQYSTCPVYQLCLTCGDNRPKPLQMYTFSPTKLLPFILPHNGILFHSQTLLLLLLLLLLLTAITANAITYAAETWCLKAKTVSKLNSTQMDFRRR